MFFWVSCTTSRSYFITICKIAVSQLKFALALGISPDFWLKMQMQRDLWLEQQRPSRFKVDPFPREMAAEASQ